LAGQLYAACQGVSACSQALIRPHDGFEDACAELRSTVKIHMDCAPRNTGQFHQEAEYDNDEKDNNGQYFVDRKQGGFGSNNDRQKICFVCKRAGCWSTRHTPSEHQGRIKSWRTYMVENELPNDNDTLGMFIIDYEGYEANQNDGESNLIDMFNAWSEDKIEQFHTSYGTIDGQNTAILLNNQAAIHALTGNVPF
ncbi:hypothetical protein K3495_g12921, partial [Podosphaera aphanis]